jgi:PadR family transcriptional regulator, regulatory protein AphA
MAKPSALTPTSYALLGLLSVQPWTTYELAKQVDRTMNRFWPRAKSKLYEEPKKLVAHGLARAHDDAHGKRPRTVYTITAAGRRALAEWLAAPSSEPLFESEHVLKTFFADSGTTDDLRATIAGLRSFVHEKSAHNEEVGSSYLEGEGPYPERLAVLVLTGRFLDDYLEMLDRWAAWADELVADWPDRPADAAPDLDALAETVRHAADRAARVSE